MLDVLSNFSVRCSLQNIRRVKPHFHHNQIVIMHCVSGEVEVFRGNSKTLLYKGQTAVIGCDEVHYVKGRGGNKVMTAHIEIDAHIPLNCTAQMPVNGANQMRLNCTAHILAASGELMECLFTLLYFEGADELIDDEEYLSLCRRISELVRECFEIRVQGSNGRLIREIIRRVQNGYRADLSIRKFAKEYGISAQYLSNLFREAGLGTFRQFLDDVRCREADKRICNSNRPVHEIAAECGFSSADVFIKHYKKYCGKTPLQMRKTYQKSSLSGSSGINEYGGWVAAETACKCLGRMRIKEIRNKTGSA